MNFKLLLVTLAAVFVAFRVETCCAQFFPNPFNNNNGNNQFPSLFPVLNGQNERPVSNWPFISNPSQQNLNDQTGQSPNSQQPWQQQSLNQPQQNQQPFGGDTKENNNNYFGSNPFLNFGFPSWFGSNNNKPRPYQNSNNRPQPGYQQQQQQQQPSGTHDFTGDQQQQQPHQTPNQPPSYQQQQQQPVGNPEYSGGKQQPGILPSSYQQNLNQQASENPNQPGYQISNQQNQNQQGYQNQNPNQSGYQNSNQQNQNQQGHQNQNPQYVPQQEAQQQQRPQQQPFDDGQYRPDKYGGGGGFKPSYNPSQGNIYAPTQHQPHNRDLVGDLRGSQLDLEKGPAAGSIPPNNESGHEASPTHWVYPDD